MSPRRHRNPRGRHDRAGTGRADGRGHGDRRRRRMAVRAAAGRGHVVTAPNTAPRWRLPWRYHDQHPTHPRDIQEWAVEKLVADFCDTGDEDFFRLWEDRRSDWTCAQVWEAVDR